MKFTDGSRKHKGRPGGQAGEQQLRGWHPALAPSPQAAGRAAGKAAAELIARLELHVPSLLPPPIVVIALLHRKRERMHTSAQP